METSARTVLTSSGGIPPASSEASDPSGEYVPWEVRIRRRRQRVALLVAVVLVAVLAVSFSLWPSLLYGTPRRSSSIYVPNGVPVDYYHAAAIAASLPTPGNGSSWILVAAEGIRLPTGTVGFNVTTEFGVSGCTLGPGKQTSDQPPNGTQPFRLSSTPASAPPGEAAAWVFVAVPFLTIEYGHSGYFLGFLVVNGTAGYVEGIATGTCTYDWYNRGVIFNPVNPGYVPVSLSLDSTTVASVFNKEGGASFLTNHTGAIQRYLLLGSSFYLQEVGTWETSYTTCSYGSGQGTGAVISAQYNASTDATLEGPSMNVSAAC